MKIVINKCYGEFNLSKEAYKYLGLKWDRFRRAFDDDRTNPKLIEVVEKLGEKANGRGARLTIIEIPEDVEYIIQEYDGIEWVAEKHRTWG